MIPDPELLRQYAHEGNGAAFTEVVHRHTNLVYSAALRMVAGDAHLAQDVAQHVFIALAKQAGALAGRADIVGWLYTTTHHSASAAVRTERRRRAREQAAFTMQEEPTRPEVDWSRLQPVLDEEVCRLAPADRDAVLQRFFQGKSHREIGESLGLSEDLARKRIERAMEKLRTAFSRRGLTISSALLAESISLNSVQAAPAGLAADLASVSLTTVGQAGLASSVGTALFIAMKTKIILIVSVLIAGLLLFQVWPGRQSDRQNQPDAGMAGTKSVRATGPATLAPGATANHQVQSPSLPAVAASATGAPAGIGSARGDLNAAMQEMLQLVAAQDYNTLIMNYLPQKGTPPADPSNKVIHQIGIDDLAMQKLFQQYAEIITAAKDTEPVFSADGRTARLPVPNSDQSLVFVLLDGHWRIAGTETPMPEGSAPPTKPSAKKNPSATGGGYVP